MQNDTVVVSRRVKKKNSTLPVPVRGFKIGTLRSTIATSTKMSFKITSFHFPNFFVYSPVLQTFVNYPNYSGTEVGGTALKLSGKK